MKFEVTSLNEAPKNWSLKIDGEDVIARHLELNSRWGKLSFGMRPEGFEGWAWEGAGGVVTLPYVHEDGQLLIGLLAEHRPNMSETAVYCVIGGFVDPGEDDRAAQARESMEEAEIDTTRAFEMKGVPTLEDRMYFVGEYGKVGNRAYALRFELTDLEEVGDHWELRKGASASGLKKPQELHFFPWREAVRITADSLARSAIALLLCELL